MSVLAALHFGGGARTPQILQTEAAECGLACIAMIAGFHGHAVDLATRRSRLPISAKGAGLAQLREGAVQLQLAARPVRLEFAALARLNCPAILHWDMNHFVVLVDLRKSGAVIHDPARGRCRLTHAELSRHFTGVAVEITPTHEFAPLDARGEARDHRGPAARLGARGLRYRESVVHATRGGPRAGRGGSLSHRRARDRFSDARADTGRGDGVARLGADGVQHADPLAARQQSLSSLVASAHGLFREAPPR